MRETLGDYLNGYLRLDPVEKKPCLRVRSLLKELEDALNQLDELLRFSMTTVVILAGGKSQRMGQDKALILGGVERIRKLVIQMGEYRIITLCGDKRKKALFSGGVA